MLRRALARRIVTVGCVVVALALVSASLAGRAPDVRTVRMLDLCDPETFNEMFPSEPGDPPTCGFDHPGVSVFTFLKVLGLTHTIGAWHFSPREVRVRDGQAVQAQNDGGEVHTFTEVAAFGGGFITELNDLVEAGPPRPECLNFAEIEFIPAGETGTAEEEEPGTHLYMCCIHPWMRATVTVR